jgi:D-alanyl-D-alanine carboxypeptidase
MQVVIDAIHDASLARKDKDNAMEIEHKRQLASIEEAKQKAYAETVAAIMGSISEDLVAAMTSKSNNDMTVAIAQAIAPYALAGENESVSDVVNKLLRGTALEQLIDDVNVNI